MLGDGRLFHLFVSLAKAIKRCNVNGCLLTWTLLYWCTIRMISAYVIFFCSWALQRNTMWCIFRDSYCIKHWDKDGFMIFQGYMFAYLRQSGRVCMFFFFLKSSALQKKVRHQMSTILLIKQSKIFTELRWCRADLQHQYIRRETVQYIWLSSRICVTKEYSLTVAHYTRPDCFYLNLWLTSRKPDRFTIHFYVTQLDFFF